MNSAAKIAKARSDLIRIQPFFGTLALRLEPRECRDDPRVTHMGTDGRFLYYNPDEVDRMPSAHVIGVVAHEVLHCAFQHPFRRKHRLFEKWNRACDYAINSILLKEGYSLPSSRLFNPAFSDMSAEEIYQKLDDEPSSGGAGSWNIGANLDPAAPDPTTGQERSDSEISSLSHDWEIATKQAAHIAKAAGSLPGYLASIIEELLEPQISWREQLWRFFNNRKPDRITWNRPNRRLIGAGVYLPSRRLVPKGSVVVAIDTSGSISEEELQHFASELNEIHKMVQPEKLYVLDVDTQIHEPIKEYGPYDKLVLEYKGRGGTDFAPVFEWVRERNMRPEAVVYLTDGYAHWPEEVTEYPVLWVITNNQVTPPWGIHLTLEI